VPAVVKRGQLQIAVGTEGQCPAYSSHLRTKLEKIFTENHGRFLAELKTVRETILENVTEHNRRKTILGTLVGDESFDYFVENGPAKWQNYARSLIEGENRTQDKK